MSPVFISSVSPLSHTHSEKPALWFIYCQGQLVLTNSDQKPLISNSNPIPMFQTLEEMCDASIPVLACHYLGLWQNQDCYCAEIADFPEALKKQYRLISLKEAALSILNNDIFHLSGKALQILNWDKNTVYCSRCQEKLMLSETERVKSCPACHMHFYPKISPCIIVLVKRGKEMLLARSPHFTPNVYGLLAGFIEPGEDIEHAVAREVMEEVGIKIKNIRYQCSQPWPFPDSLMLGFTADYAAGEIMIDGQEIEDAGWYTVDNMPTIPTSISIARKLIDAFIQQHSSSF